MSTHRTRLTCLGSDVVFDAPESLLPWLGRLVPSGAQGPSPFGGGAEAYLRIAADGQGWRVFPPDPPSPEPARIPVPDASFPTLPGLLGALESRITGWAVRHCGAALALHAAGLVHPGGATLILGASGSGKSSIALAWSRAGGLLLGDDLVLVGWDGELYASRRWIKVDRERAVAAGLDPTATFAYDPGDPEVWLDPSEIGAGFAAGPHPLRRIVHVRYRPDSSPESESMNELAVLQSLVLSRTAIEVTSEREFDLLQQVGAGVAGQRTLFSSSAELVAGWWGGSA